MVTDIAGVSAISALPFFREVQNQSPWNRLSQLRVSLETADRLGHIRAQVDITPDNLTQSHRFEFEIDQSYLPNIIEKCAAIVQKYPIRGQRDPNPEWMKARALP